MCAVGLTPIGIPMLGRWWMTPVACWGRRSSGPVSSGYVQLERWLRFWGPLVQAGVEGTGSYGAGLARHLNAAGVEMVEVMRPNRQLRRLRDKTDTVDAEAAARAALSGLATARPKAGDGPVEGIKDAAGGSPLRGQGPHPGRQPDPCPSHNRPRAGQTPTMGLQYPSTRKSLCSVPSQ